MSTYLLRRLFQTIPVVFGVVLIAFALSQLSGTPIRGLLGPNTNPETIRKVTEYYGFDKPWYVRFGKYLGNLGHGDLGVSILNHGRPVREMIFNGMGVTFKLALGAMIIGTILGV